MAQKEPRGLECLSARMAKEASGQCSAFNPTKVFSDPSEPNSICRPPGGGKRWSGAHPERERSRAKRYRVRNRKKVRAYHRKWMRKWYAANRDQARRQLRLRRIRHRNKWRAYDRKIYRAKMRLNPEKYARKLAQGRSWARRNPLKQRHRIGRYRARTMMAQGSHSFEQWMARVKIFRWRCNYCSSKLNSATLTKDHRVPLSKGGTDFARNLVPACRSCNSGKKDRRWRAKSRKR
jgi:5-methylcytosine-specific restriction endonuclease McrA